MKWTAEEVRLIAELVPEGVAEELDARAAELHRLAPLVAALLNAASEAKRSAAPEPDDSGGESCGPGCRGYGPVLRMDETWSLQRCDGCSRYEDDDAAALAACHESIEMLWALEGFSFDEAAGIPDLAWLAGEWRIEAAQ